MAVLSATAMPAQGAIRDSFVAQGRPVSVSIATARLGVLAVDARSAVRVRARARALGLRSIATYNDRIVILGLRRPLARAGLRARAAALRAQLGAAAEKVGLVVTPRGARTPLVLTDEVIVSFDDGVTPEAARRAIARAGGEVREENPFEPGEYLVAVAGDALRAANRLHRAAGVAFSHPNFTRPREFRWVPTDPLFEYQWHHFNSGANVGVQGGTEDADVDANLAWDITRGTPDTVVAVLDDGFEPAHPDLIGNLWVNAGEIAGNGVDDNADGFADDVHGWNFDTGTPVYTPRRHGTAVAGLVAATADNEGMVGLCPECRLMLVQIEFDAWTDGLAIRYAAAHGADVINNSWGYPHSTTCMTNVCKAIDYVTANGRGGLGTVVVFAMGPDPLNPIPEDNCSATYPDLASDPDVIAVGGITNRDARSPGSDWGDCIDLLAPATGSTRRTSTMWTATTDLTGAAGFNDGGQSGGGGSGCLGGELLSEPDYTTCFYGNSGAAALVSAAAGLLLSYKPGLTRRQVQTLLQDTADRADDADAEYLPKDGFSVGAQGASTHGYGRLNAFEALRVLEPPAPNHPGLVDLFMGDNTLDWGNTESPTNVKQRPVRVPDEHWESTAIKLDNTTPQGGGPQGPPTTPAEFDAFTHEDAVEGDNHVVYVEVRNRGVAPGNGEVHLYYMDVGTAMPNAPPTFWNQFPNSTPPGDVHWLGKRTLVNVPPSGSTAAHQGGTNDRPQIVSFPFPGPPVDTTKPNPSHFCLWAIITGPDDPVMPTTELSPDRITPFDNNVTQLNIRVNKAPGKRAGKVIDADKVFIRNPTDDEARSQLSYDAPRRWKVSIDKFRFGRPFTLAPRAEILARVTIRRPRRQKGTVIIRQSVVERATGKVTTGGLTYRIGAGKRRRPSPR